MGMKMNEVVTNKWVRVSDKERGAYEGRKYIELTGMYQSFSKNFLWGRKEISRKGYFIFSSLLCMCVPLKKRVLCSEKKHSEKTAVSSAVTNPWRKKGSQMPDALVMLPELEKWECLASDPFQKSCFERVAWSLSTWKKDGDSPKGRCPKDNHARFCPVTIFSW